MTKMSASIPASSQTGGVTILSLEFDPTSDGWFLYSYKALGEAPLAELWHMSKEDALEQAANDWNVQSHDWNSADDEDSSTPTRDSNGAELKDGDNVTLIKDLDVKGAGTTIKRGTTVNNITLTNDPELIDCRTKEIKGLVLKTCFVKKI